MTTKDRAKRVEKAYYYFYTFRDSLSVGEVHHPVTGKVETRILYEDLQTAQKVIALQLEEKRECIEFYYKRAKGEGARKLKKRVDDVFTLVSEPDIQSTTAASTRR